MATRSLPPPVRRTTVAVPRDFLTPYERPVRLPLPEWAASLTVRLARGDPLERAAATNQAALVFAYLGERGLARELCHALLERTAAHAAALRADGDADGAARSLTAAIDPWVNLGRLDGLDGDWCAARAAFDAVAALHRGEGACLGPCALTPDDWAAMPRMHPVAEAIDVIDVSKALFAAGRHGDARTVLQAGRGYGAMAPIVDEGLLICAAAGAEHEAVVATTAGGRHASTAYGRAVALLYETESRIALGDARAVDVARVVAADVLDDAVADVAATALLRFLVRACDALALVDEERLAAAVGVTGMELALDVGDEPAEWDFLERLCASPNGERWAGARADLFRRSHYRSIRALTDPAAAPHSDLSAVYGELLGAARRPD